MNGLTSFQIIPDILPSFLSVMLLVFLIFLTIQAGKTQRENQLFAIFCLLLLGHRLVITGCRYLDSGAPALTLFRVVHLGFVFILPVSVHYVHRSLGRFSGKASAVLIPAFYIFSLLLVPLIPTESYVSAGTNLEKPWIPSPGPVFSLFLGVSVLTLLAYTVHLIRLRRTMTLTDSPEHARWVYLSAGFIPTFFLILGDALPLYGFDMPYTGSFVFIPLGIFTFGIFTRQILDNKGWFSISHIPNFLTALTWLPLVLALVFFAATHDRLFYQDIASRLVPLGLPPIVSCLGCFALATFCFQKGSRKVQTLAFGGICVLWGILNLDITLLFILKDPETALLLNRIDHFFLVMQLGFCCHFFHFFADFRKRMVALAYAISLVFVPLTQTPYYLKGIHTYSWGFFASRGILFDILMLVTVLAIGAGSVQLLRKTRRSTSNLLEFKQNLFSFIGVMSMALIGLSNIPAMSGIDVYPMGTFIFIPLLLMAYGVFRYDVVKINEYTKRRLWSGLSAGLIFAGYTVLFGWLAFRVKHFPLPGLLGEMSGQVFFPSLTLASCLFFSVLSLRSGLSQPAQRVFGIACLVPAYISTFFLLFTLTGTPQTIRPFSFIQALLPFAVILSGLGMFRHNIKEILGLIDQVLYSAGILAFVLTSAMLARSLWLETPQPGIGLLFSILLVWIVCFKGVNALWSAVLSLFFGSRKDTLDILFSGLSDALSKSRSFADIARTVGACATQGILAKEVRLLFHTGTPGRFLTYVFSDPAKPCLETATIFPWPQPLFALFSQTQHAVTQEQLESWIADQDLTVDRDHLLRTADILQPVHFESVPVCLLVFNGKTDGSVYSVLEKEFITRIGLILGPHIENVRLLSSLETEVRTRTADLTDALKEITLINNLIRASNASLNLDGILESLYRLLSPYVRFQAVFIQLVEPDQTTLRLVKAFGPDLDPEKKKHLETLGFSLEDPHSVSASCIHTRASASFTPGSPDRIHGLLEKNIHRLVPFTSLLMFPMEIRNAVIGNLVFVSTEAPFDLSQKTMDTLESYVRQIATAVNNARLYDRAEAAAAAKSDFLAKMSHEIRSPLNAVLGMGRMLSQTTLDGEQRRHLDVMMHSGELLLYVINGILDFSRLETGRVDVESVSFDLHRLMENIRDILAAVSAKKGLAIRLSMGSGLPRFVSGDPFKLAQVLINLGDNAIRFTEKGTITLQVKIAANTPDDPALTFCIDDPGIGIPVEKIALIFESFTQAESSTTRRFGGTGLGLSISRKLVELMGGSLEVESEINRGSRFFFTVRLPEAEVSPATTPLSLSTAVTRMKSFHETAAIRHDPEPWTDHEKTTSILLAEDIGANVLVVKNDLKDLPVSLDVAEDGLKAFTMFKARRYDLVLMDIHMPRMDGHEALRKIRAWEVENRPAAPPTPVAALSAHVMEPGVDTAGGFDAFLVKPFGKEQLIRTVLDLTFSPEAAHKKKPGPGLTIDPALTGIICELKKEICEEIPTLEKALWENDDTTGLRLSHGFKGAAGNCGLTELSRQFKTLHDHFLEKNHTLASQTLGMIQEHLDSLDLSADEGESLILPHFLDPPEFPLDFPDPS